jgi:predicted kinase
MVILVMGLPGSGKSFFASRLAEAIHAEYISSDRLRMDLITNRTYSEKEKELVYNEMLVQMENFIKLNKDVILDATFYKKRIREKFRKKAFETDTIACIEVIAPEDIIKRRLSHAREFSEADYTVYKAIQSEWDPISEKHLVLRSTDDNIDRMLRKAIRYLHLIKNEQGTG